MIASMDGTEVARDRTAAVRLVVDAANVVGARPDGWWRDRAGAARRLMDGLRRLPGRQVTSPDGPVTVSSLTVVLEGRAREAAGEGQEESVGDVEVVLAPGSGDDAIVELVVARVDAGYRLALVTADRGLRARLPERVATWGPGWLRDLLDHLEEDETSRA